VSLNVARTEAERLAHVRLGFLAAAGKDLRKTDEAVRAGLISVER
jgi:hypothetical protein